MVPKHEKRDPLEKLFVELFRHKFAEHGMLLPKSDTLLEMNAALQVQMEARKETCPAEGRAEASETPEAIAENLITLLTERFGTLAPHWQKRIRRAQLITLKRYFNRATMAPDLRSIFD